MYINYDEAYESFILFTYLYIYVLGQSILTLFLRFGYLI
jgi:hypothetical protein